MTDNAFSSLILGQPLMHGTFSIFKNALRSYFYVGAACTHDIKKAALFTRVVEMVLQTSETGQCHENSGNESVSMLDMLFV